MIDLNPIRLRPGRLIGAAAVALALGFTACGDDEGGGASDGAGPASLVPADAPAYLESVVRPEGEARETIDRLYEAATGETDPGAKLIEEIDAGAEQEGVDFSYEDDISPWLGERAGFFFGDAKSLVASGGEVSVGSTNLETVDPGCLPPEAPDGEPLEGVDSISPDDEACAPPEPADATAEAEDVAVIVETTDAEAAREALDKAAELSASESDAQISVSDETYEDVEYMLFEEEGDTPVALGIVDGFLVVGDRAGFESTVDTAGGDSLAEDAEFTEGVSELSDEPFFAGYADAPAIFEEIEAAGTLDPADEAALDVYRGYIEQPVFLTGEIDAEAIEFASSTGAIGATLTEAGLLDELPAGSLAAFGVPDLGDYVNTFIDQFRSEPSFESQFDAASDQFQREVGVSLEDAIGNVGDLRGFVRGESVLSIDGAIGVEVEDSGTAGELIEGLGRSARADGEPVRPVSSLPGVEDAEGIAVAADGVPQPIYVIQSGDQFVISYGEEAAAELLAPTEPLGEDERFVEAVEDIDDVDPSFYVDIAPIQQLVASAPVTPEEFDRDATAAVLGEFEYLIAGARSDGDRDITRYRAGLTGD